MDFHLTREQDMLRETVRAFAEEVLKPRAAGLDRSREFPVDNYRRCAELGLCGMMVPEAYGGAGFDGVSYVIAIEEVSRACASTGVILSVNNSLLPGWAVRLAPARAAGGRLATLARAVSLALRPP